jgi:PIN domain nuclease of toxin-antitoxin system
MAVILDTQIIIWLETEHEKISHKALDEVKNEELVYISMASVWEIAIKIKIEKLKLKNDIHYHIDELQRAYQFKLLNFQLSHIYYLRNLPLIHRDPFDRIIASQSIVEKIPLISSDKIFDEYNIKRIW